MLSRCRLWAVALAGATLTCGNPAAASAIRTPIGKIASQRVISYQSSGGYFCRTPFDVPFLNEALWVALNVKQPGVHPRVEIRDEPDEWKDGIEEAWKNRLAVSDQALWYPGNFQVAWATSYEDKSDSALAGSGGGDGALEPSTDPAATAAVLASLDPIPLHLAGRFGKMRTAGGGAAHAIVPGPAVEFLVGAVLVGVGIANFRSGRRRRRSRGGA